MSVKIVMTGDACETCGCTAEDACVNGPLRCHWVAPGLCSFCQSKVMILYAQATGRPGLYDAGLFPGDDYRDHMRVGP